jgi:hypothetical protein
VDDLLKLPEFVGYQVDLLVILDMVYLEHRSFLRS